MGRIGKAAGILIAVIVPILIKGVLDTINLLPVVPGRWNCCLVVGSWSWSNLRTTPSAKSWSRASPNCVRNTWLSTASATTPAAGGSDRCRSRQKYWRG